MSDREPAGEGAARRRRERRLRQWARHEKLAVQMALAEYKHHASRGQRKARAGGEVRVVPHGGVPEAPLPQGGSRPPCLGVPRGPHVGMERHVVEDLGELAPLVQILDLPVPQVVDFVADALRSWISRLPSRLSMCPRSPALRVPLVLLFLSRSQRTVGGSADRAVSHPHRLADRGTDR